MCPNRHIHLGQAAGQILASPLNIIHFIIHSSILKAQVESHAGWLSWKLLFMFVVCAIDARDVTSRGYDRRIGLALRFVASVIYARDVTSRGYDRRIGLALRFVASVMTRLAVMVVGFVSKENSTDFD